MSNGLATQIRGTFEALDDAQTPLTVEEIMHRAGPVRPVPIEEPRTVERNWRVPLLVAAVAAAVVLIALVPVLFLNTQPDQTPATTPSTVTSTTLESAPPSTAAESSNVEDQSAAAPPVQASQSLVDPYDLPRATEVGWVWNKTPVSSALGPLSSGRYVRVDRGWECSEWDEARNDWSYYLTETAEGCAGPIAAPIERVEFSTDGSVWHEGTLPVDPVAWQPASFMRIAGVDYRQFYRPDGGESQWFATTDGESWFVPLVDGGPMQTFFGPSFQIKNILIVSQRRQNDTGGIELAYFGTTDDGRTFFSAAVSPSVADQPHTMYVNGDVLEAIVWNDVTSEGLDYNEPALWRTTNGVDWAEVGAVAGIPPLSTDPIRDRGGAIEDGPQRFGSLVAPLHTVTVLASGDRLAVGSVLGASTQSSWGPEVFSVVLISSDGRSWTEVESVRPIRGGLGDESWGAGARGATVDGWFVVAWEECFSDRESCNTGAIGTSDGQAWFRFIGPDDRRLTISTRPHGVYAELIEWIADRDGGSSSTVVEGERYIATPATP